MGRGNRCWTACWALALAFSLSGSARAYSYHTVATRGCHEKITASALRAVRQELSTARALPSRHSDEVLIDELPFPLDDDMRDIGAATLLLGVRDNDLKGRHGLDSTDLATVHGDPDGQREHCLRRPGHDEPPLDGPEPDGPVGSEAALAECRDYIVAMMRHAIEAGLDEEGRPDPDARTILAAHFAFSGHERVSVPIFYLYAGHALHALQDSFTHAFRTEDGRRVTVILNWVDFAEDNLEERRDGPPHLVELDRCDDPDSLRSLRRRLATEASARALRASLDPALDDAAKLEALDAVLDDFMGFEPGCTFDNRWCDAPENAYRGDGCTCRLGPAQRAGRAGGAALVAFAAALGLARRWPR